MNAMNIVKRISCSVTTACIYLAETLIAFKRNEKAVTAVEYAIVIAGIAAVVAVIFATDGPVANMLTSVFTTIQTKVGSIVNPG